MRQLVADWREMLTEQVQYRELLYEMTRRDLLIRYKQTVMGFGWAVFTPLVNTAVFSVIFMQVTTLETPVPYPLFAYCGLLAWNFSASTFRASVGSLTSNASLVTKVYFPREIFPFSAMLVSLVDLVVGSSVLVALMIWYQMPPSGMIILLPLVIFVHAAFTAAVSLIVALGNLFYRDVKYIFEVVISLWLFATAILYPVEAVSGWYRTLLLLNPMTGIINAYRDAVFGTRSFDVVTFTIVAVFSIALLAGAWLLFHRSEFQFAERI